MKKAKLDKKLQEKVGRDFVKEGIIVTLANHYPEIIQEIEKRTAEGIFLQLDELIDTDHPMNYAYLKLKERYVK